MPDVPGEAQRILSEDQHGYPPIADYAVVGEARRFAGFLRRCCDASRPRLQIMYGIDGETELAEEELPHLDGYAGRVRSFSVVMLRLLRDRRRRHGKGPGVSNP